MILSRDNSVRRRGGTEGFCRRVFTKKLFDRVVAAFSERIAAQDAPDSHTCSFNSPVFFNSVRSILGAGGVETAAWRLERGYKSAVKPDDPHQSRSQNVRYPRKNLSHVNNQFQNAAKGYVSAREPGSGSSLAFSYAKTPSVLRIRTRSR